MTREVSLCLPVHLHSRTICPCFLPPRELPLLESLLAAVSQGDSPPSARALLLPIPTAIHGPGQRRRAVKRPLHPAAQRTAGTEEVWGWRWQLRDTMGHLWCPILPRRWAWGAGEL